MRAVGLFRFRVTLPPPRGRSPSGPRRVRGVSAAAAWATASTAAAADRKVPDTICSRRMQHPALEAASINGVMFDLWNTLVYTDFHPNPIAALANAFGLDAAPDWRRQIERAIMTRRLSGISEAIDAIAQATGRDISAGTTRRDLILLWGEASNRSRLASDALPALRSLREFHDGGRRYRLGILSNTQSFDLDFIEREGLAALVDDICLSSDCGLLKPDPRLYT